MALLRIEFIKDDEVHAGQMVGELALATRAGRLAAILLSGKDLREAPTGHWQNAWKIVEMEALPAARAQQLGLFQSERAQ